MENQGFEKWGGGGNKFQWTLMENFPATKNLGTSHFFFKSGPKYFNGKIKKFQWKLPGILMETLGALFLEFREGRPCQN